MKTADALDAVIAFTKTHNGNRIYSWRKQTIERSFAEAKVNHGLRYARMLGKEYIEQAEDIRHTKLGKKTYAKRSQTIERVFADSKEKHAMRYTPYRGLKAVTNWVKLKFATMNLKELALWLSLHLFLWVYWVIIQEFPASLWREKRGYSTG